MTVSQALDFVDEIIAAKRAQFIEDALAAGAQPSELAEALDHSDRQMVGWRAALAEVVADLVLEMHRRPPAPRVH